MAELSNDSRIASWPAEIREAVLSDIGDQYQQCAGSETGKLYDCPCVARLLLDARVRAGIEVTGRVLKRGPAVEFKVPSGRLLFDVWNNQSHSCIVPPNVEKYFSDLAYRLVIRGSEQERKSRAACAARVATQSFIAKPKPDTAYIRSLVVSALAGACQ